MIDDLWYKNAIIYSVNVGTFLDSNGDGIGDFEGLSRRLDYLSGLGVTCIPRSRASITNSAKSAIVPSRESTAA